MNYLWSNQLHMMPKPTWIVDGLIPGADDGCCGMLCGREGSYKSFLALDLAAHISEARPDWLGHKILSPGPALYVVGERMSEVPKRVSAWMSHYNATRPISGIAFIPEPVSLNSTKAINELTDIVDSFPTKPRVIILDTLAKCMNGVDEDSATEVGVVLANLDRLQRRYGATILLLHHLNKSGRSRGSTAINGHVSFEIHSNKADHLACFVEFKKMSCGSEPEKRRVQLSETPTDYGKTLVVSSSTEVKPEPKAEPKPKREPKAKPARTTAHTRIEEHLRGLEAWPGPTEVAAALCLPLGTVKSAMKRLKDA